jgi:hypothetical protein
VCSASLRNFAEARQNAHEEDKLATFSYEKFRQFKSTDNSNGKHDQKLGMNDEIRSPALQSACVNKIASNLSPRTD